MGSTTTICDVRKFIPAHLARSVTRQTYISASPSYDDDCGKESMVGKEQFEKQLEAVLNEMETLNRNTGLYALDHPGLKVMRESVVFAGGGRATFMQLAHPFIAAGIRSHSQLQHGVSRRFYNTFKYMFGMTFGSRAEMAASARTVRGMHDKVFGRIEEDVGVFRADSKFNAHQEKAMRWVGATLLETAVFEYEIHVHMLTEKEKDAIVVEGDKLMMMFGVRPKADDPQSWKEFCKFMSMMWKSKLLTVSETAKDTSEFLLLPPSPRYRPMLDFIRWSTIVSCPPRIAKQYYGRSANTVDKLVYAILHGIIRFVYRLTPGSWRFLSAYWRMIDRTNHQRWFFQKWTSNAAAAFTNMLLKGLMPVRDPEETMKQVTERRKASVLFTKVPNSPVKIALS